jgi:hypothetical protein
MGTPGFEESLLVFAFPFLELKLFSHLQVIPHHNVLNRHWHWLDAFWSIDKVNYSRRVIKGATRLLWEPRVLRVWGW